MTDDADRAEGEQVDVEVLRRGLHQEDERTVHIGSTSPRGIWFGLGVLIVLVAAAIFAAVWNWIVVVAIVLGVIAVFLLGFLARDWLSQRFTSGLLQLPFPGRETARANKAASRRVWVEPTAGEARPDAPLHTGIGIALSEDWDMFVSALADAMRPALPAGFHIAADQTTLRFAGADHIGTSELASNLASSSGDEVARAVRASLQALTDLQAFVVSVEDQPWPGEHASPSPGADSLDDMVRLWYGDESYPVLRLTPIAYRRVGRSRSDSDSVRIAPPPTTDAPPGR